MEIILVIYIISVIGAILTIRYDSYFNKDSNVLFIVFCPIVNSVVSIIDLFAYTVYYSEKLNKKLYRLITYKKNNK